MTQYGLQSQRKRTQKWGGSDGISGGDTKYDEVSVPNGFKIIDSNINKKNITTDKPWNFHVNK